MLDVPFFLLVLCCHLKSTCTYLSLRVVSDAVGDLRELAKEMGGELDHQNIVTDRILEKTDVNNVHLDQANRRIIQLS